MGWKLVYVKYKQKIYKGVRYFQVKCPFARKCRSSSIQPEYDKERTVTLSDNNPRCQTAKKTPYMVKSQELNKKNIHLIV